MSLLEPLLLWRLPDTVDTVTLRSTIASNATTWILTSLTNTWYCRYHHTEVYNREQCHYLNPYFSDDYLILSIPSHWGLQSRAMLLLEPLLLWRLPDTVDTVTLRSTIASNVTTWTLTSLTNTWYCRYRDTEVYNREQCHYLNPYFSDDYLILSIPWQRGLQSRAMPLLEPLLLWRLPDTVDTVTERSTIASNVTTWTLTSLTTTWYCRHRDREVYNREQCHYLNPYFSDDYLILSTPWHWGLQSRAMPLLEPLLLWRLPDTVDTVTLRSTIASNVTTWTLTSLTTTWYCRHRDTEVYNREQCHYLNPYFSDDYLILSIPSHWGLQSRAMSLLEPLLLWRLPDTVDTVTLRSTIASNATTWTLTSLTTTWYCRYRDTEVYNREQWLYLNPYFSDEYLILSIPWHWGLQSRAMSLLEPLLLWRLPDTVDTVTLRSTIASNVTTWILTSLSLLTVIAGSKPAKHRKG